MHSGPERLHEHAAVRLAVVRGTHLPHLAPQPERRAGEREGAAPLAGPCFGGDLLDPEFFVVPGLGYRGIGFVAPRGTDAFIFVIDTGRSFKVLLKIDRPLERRTLQNVEWCR